MPFELVQLFLELWTRRGFFHQCERVPRKFDRLQRVPLNVLARDVRLLETAVIRRVLKSHDGDDIQRRFLAYATIMLKLFTLSKIKQFV